MKLIFFLWKNKINIIENFQNKKLKPHQHRKHRRLTPSVHHALLPSTSVNPKRCRFNARLCIKSSASTQPSSTTTMAAMLKPASLNPFRFHFQELPLIDCTLIRPNLKDSRNFQFNLCLNRSKNGSVLPIVRAQSSPGMNCDLNSHFLA